MSKKRRLLIKEILAVVAILLITSPLWAVGPLVGSNGKMSWNVNTETDLAGYKVYIGTAPGNYTITRDVGKTPTLTAPLVQVSTFNLVDGQYYAAVTAYDTAGNESAKSVEAPFLFNGVAPAAPQNFSVVP